MKLLILTEEDIVSKHGDGIPVIKKDLIPQFVEATIVLFVDFRTIKVIKNRFGEKFTGNCGEILEIGE